MAAARHWNAKAVRTLQHFGVGFAKRLQIGEDWRQPAGRAALAAPRQGVQADSREQDDIAGAVRLRQVQPYPANIDHVLVVAP